MRRRTAGLAIAAAIAGACGGGSGSPSAPTVPSSDPSGDASRVAPLDAGTFEPLVLGSGRAGLVEFHSPT